MKTAVDWLVEQICGDHTSEWQEQIEQAKAMEKEQIIEAYEYTAIGTSNYGQQYYTQTYESNT